MEHYRLPGILFSNPRGFWLSGRASDAVPTGQGLEPRLRSIFLSPDFSMGFSTRITSPALFFTVGSFFSVAFFWENTNAPGYFLLGLCSSFFFFVQHWFEHRLRLSFFVCFFQYQVWVLVRIIFPFNTVGSIFFWGGENYPLPPGDLLLCPRFFFFD